MRVFDMIETNEATPGGSHSIKLARARPETYTVKGSAVDVDALRRGRLPEFNATGGYALTPGIPRDFWELWLEQNRNAPYVRNHCIFAASTEDRARAKVRNEYAGVMSGLEPIDPERPWSKAAELGGLNNIRIERGTTS
jgi:hypothetical protein